MSTRQKLCMILPLALILCFMVSCQDKEAMAELEKFKAQAEVEEQNKELIRNLFKEFNKGNVEIIKEFYTSDSVSSSPSNATPISPVEAIPIIKMFYNDVFPDLEQSIEELIAVGDKVVVRLIARGTHKGEYLGIPATGNKIEISGITIFRIENGKIVEERSDVDMLGMMMQLGMELKPKEKTKEK